MSSEQQHSSGHLEGGGGGCFWFEPMEISSTIGSITNVGLITSLDSGRHIHQSTALWMKRHVWRWWNGPNEVCPACSSPDMPVFPGCSAEQHRRRSAFTTAFAYSLQRVGDKFTFSMSNFLLIVMHLFKRSLYFSSNFCCSSICLLRSQFAYEAERTLVYLVVVLMNKPCTYTVRVFYESIPNRRKFFFKCTSKKFPITLLD